VITQERSALRGRMLKTGQLTPYMAGDDGDYERGMPRVYTVYTTGGYSGTTAFNVAHYAAATLSFTAATKTIADSANGLVTVKTGDTVVISGSGSNDGTYTVAGGGVAGSFTTTQALVNELAGAYVTIYKQASISNNCVIDKNTGLMWLRNTTGSLKIGPASTGTLNFYDATTCFVLHPAAGDLQMTLTGLKIVGGAGEVARYKAGMIIVCSGFANAANNLPGYPISTVAVNGADLDITLNKFNNTLVAEAAAGSRAISIICQSAFTFCAAANLAVVGGYSDWRVPNDVSLLSLRDMEAPSAVPDTTAFPGWPADFVNSSTTRANSTTGGMPILFTSGAISQQLKTVAFATALVRGGFS
jgi:hypothetical protein